MLIDSHCHLQMMDLEPYDGDLDKAIAAQFADGVEQMLCVGTTVECSKQAIAIAQSHDNIFSSAGIHPHDAATNFLTEEEILDLVAHDKVVAVGETGLDYYYNDTGLDKQQISFRRHIRVAKQLKQPVIIHTRSAVEDTLNIMREENITECGFVLHCFTESWEMAKAALDMGGYVSLSGIVTFKNAEELRDTAKKIPMDRLLIETDSPYLAPVPMRGKKCEPRYVKYVAEFLAELRGVSYQTLCEATANNFQKLFLQR